MFLFELLIFLLFFLFFIVCIVSIIKNCSVKEATIFVKRNLIIVFKTLMEEKQLFFPLYVGSDGYSIIPENVTKEFSQISQNLASFFFMNYYFAKNNSIIIYQFGFALKPSSPDLEFLYSIIQKQAEQIATKNLLAVGITIPASSLTAVYIDDSKSRIEIAFALTEEGRKSIPAFQKKSQDSLRKTINGKKEMPLEKWEEKK